MSHKKDTGLIWVKNLNMHNCLVKLEFGQSLHLYLLSVCKQHRLMALVRLNTRTGSSEPSLMAYTVSRGDYCGQNCDSIDIARSTIAILLPLWTTIAMLL